MTGGNDRVQQLLRMSARLVRVKETLYENRARNHKVSLEISIAIEHIDMAIAEIDTEIYRLY